MPAKREPFGRKKQSLGYLCDDLLHKLARLKVWDDFEQIDANHLYEIMSLTKEIASLDIGFERRLNELQYLLGEAQIYMWEGSERYQIIENCISQIQEFLDW